MLSKLFVSCVIVLLLSGRIEAQTNSARIIKLQDLYEAFQFEEVISISRQLLSGNSTLSENEIMLIHEYLAISFFTVGKTDSSYNHFLILLTMDKDHVLDPIRTSPKILDFYAEIKTEFELLDNQNRLRYVDRYIFVDDLRPGAAWRSALIPGWGQIYKSQPVKGYVLGGAFFTGLVVTTASLVKENDYRDKYLNNDNPSEISDLYDSYNSWSKVRRGAMYSTLAVWLISFSDALWSDYPRLTIDRPHSDTLSLAVSIEL